MRNVIFAGLVLLASCSPARAEYESECAQLRQLNEEWKGRPLTLEQRGKKAMAVAFYNANCRGTRTRRAATR